MHCIVLGMDGGGGLTYTLQDIGLSVDITEDIHPVNNGVNYLSRDTIAYIPTIHSSLDIQYSSLSPLIYICRYLHETLPHLIFIFPRIIRTPLK